MRNGKYFSIKRNCIVTIIKDDQCNGTCCSRCGMKISKMAYGVLPVWDDLEKIDYYDAECIKKLNLKKI